MESTSRRNAHSGWANPSYILHSLAKWCCTSYFSVHPPNVATGANHAIIQAVKAPTNGNIHLNIITYPHPTLRHVSKPVQQVDRALQRLVRQMFELMYQANGVGLAANQVDLPLRLFVMNLAADPKEGEELVIVNPIVTRPRGNEEKEEGCLSIPGVYADVVRPAKVHLHAFTIEGHEIDQEISGMMARVVQHETDHLDGVLFVDRLSDTVKREIEPELAEFQLQFDALRRRLPSDDEMQARLKQLEQQYC